MLKVLQLTQSIMFLHHFGEEEAEVVPLNLVSVVVVLNPSVNAL